MPGARFLTRVLRDRVRRGLVAGAIAAAATAGVLLGLGRARGGPFSLLNEAAHLLLGDRAAGGGFDPLVTPVAALVHLVSLEMWGVLFVLLAASLRGWRLAGAAVAFSAAVLALDVWLLPESLRPGFELQMSLPELLLLYGVMAAALGFGAREASRDTVA